MFQISRVVIYRFDCRIRALRYTTNCLGRGGHQRYKYFQGWESFGDRYMTNSYEKLGSGCQTKFPNGMTLIPKMGVWGRGRGSFNPVLFTFGRGVRVTGYITGGGYRLPNHTD